MRYRMGVSVWGLFWVLSGGAALGFTPNPTSGGVVFSCEASRQPKIESDMTAYFAELRFPLSEVRTVREADGSFRYTLGTPESVTDTFSLSTNKKLDIQPEILSYRRSDGLVVQGAFTSRKEILAALMTHGREYLLSGSRCSVAALREHVGVRQSIAKWNKVAEHRWIFPEEWNAKGELISKDRIVNRAFWTEDNEMPPGVSVFSAVADPFVGSFQYNIYCNMATKLALVQGIYDYFTNVAPDAAKVALLERAAAGKPLAHIQTYYDDKRNVTEVGKYLVDVHGVPGDNWIPGDWGYIRNVDAVSRARAGYEGSNFLYQGAGLFSDFWAPDPSGGHATHYYYGASFPTLDARLIEVYQWRRGVTENWEHDPRRAFLTAKEVEDLRRDPRDGGLLEDTRMVWSDGVGFSTGRVEF